MSQLTGPIPKKGYSDYGAEFTEKDAESKKVLDFLEQIKPEEYIRRITSGERKII